MTNCRCAKCRRREIYRATGMTLSLAWNKRLNGSCYIEKLAKNIEQDNPGNYVSQERHTVKKAS
jgi:hypothetical protein